MFVQDKIEMYSPVTTKASTLSTHNMFVQDKIEMYSPVITKASTLSTHNMFVQDKIEMYRISSIRRPPSNSSPPQIVALPSADWEK